MDENLPKTVNALPSPPPTENLGKKIIMFGLPTCPDCLRIKKFLSENAIEYEYHDVDSEKSAQKWLTGFATFVPVLIMLDQTVLYSPSNDELLNKINSSSVNQTAQPIEPQVFDTIIIGAGPAGITAAIYAVRKAIKVLILTKDIGGQASRSEDVENYPGFTMITGSDLTQKFKQDIEKFKGEGLWIKDGVSVVQISGEEGKFSVKTDQESEYLSKTIIIATGRTPKYLGVKGEKELFGKGVSTCSTCDGPFFKGKQIAIIGGGNSALDAASYMFKLAKSVVILNSGKKLAGDAEFLEAIALAKNVTVLNSCVVTEIIGKDFVQGVKYKDAEKNEKEIEVAGVFIEIGWTPSVDFAPQLSKDNQNRLKVDEFGKTNIEGIWACGDVNNLWGEQIVIAAGEGAKVALVVAEHVNKIPHAQSSNLHFQ